MRARLVRPVLFAAGLFACAVAQADERAFVTNQSAQTVSVVALPQMAVLATLAVSGKPAGVAAAAATRGTSRAARRRTGVAGSSSAR